MNDPQEFGGQVGHQHMEHPDDGQSASSAFAAVPTVLVLPREQIDMIGAEMDLLPAREVLNLTAKLAQLAPFMRRMKGKHYSNAEITQWVNQHGVGASVSSVAKALSKRAPSTSSKSGKKKL